MGFWRILERLLEWIAISSFRGSSTPREIDPESPALQTDSLLSENHWRSCQKAVPKARQTHTVRPQRWGWRGANIVTKEVVMVRTARSSVLQ